MLMLMLTIVVCCHFGDGDVIWLLDVVVSLVILGIQYCIMLLLLLLLLLLLMNYILSLSQDCASGHKTGTNTAKDWKGTIHLLS